MWCGSQHLIDSVTLLEREYRLVFHEHPPARCNINRRDKKSKVTDSLYNRKRSVRPKISEESIENIQNCFLKSPSTDVPGSFKPYNTTYN